jgi:hypothetical protein
MLILYHFYNKTSNQQPHLSDIKLAEAGPLPVFSHIYQQNLFRPLPLCNRTGLRRDAVK